MAESEAPPVSPEARGLIGWFARNHVAANLLMFCIIGVGIWSLFIVKKESFPSMGSDEITVSVPYRGAAPQEVAEGVVVKIEQAIESIQGIAEIKSAAMEGTGRVVAEVEHGYDINTVANDIKVAIDSISTFPAETERPVISKRQFRFAVLSIQVHGNLDEPSMKELAEDLRDEIAALPEVPMAEVTGSRPFEISIEVPRANAAPVRTDPGPGRPDDTAVVHRPAGRLDPVRSRADTAADQGAGVYRRAVRGHRPADAAGWNPGAPRRYRDHSRRIRRSRDLLVLQRRTQFRH